MNRTIVIAVLVAAVAIVSWMFLGRDAEHAPIAPAAALAPSAVEPAVVDPIRAPDAQSADARATAATAADVAAPAATTSSSSASSACVVVGRVVDARRAPLAGASVRLYAHKTWADGADTPKLADPRFDLRGFELQTSATGEFRIEAPVPTAARTILAVRPDRFHDSHTLYFGDSGARAQPQLTAGVRDLGEIQLADTGALRGRVLDARGVALADAEIVIGPARSQTFGRDATTAADGTFVLGHAPVGTYGMNVKSKAHLSRFVEPIVVEVGRDTQVGDVVLGDAPTIEGVVVGEDGAPLVGVKLWGWPEGDGAGAGAKSDDDGRFVLYLPQDERYSMTAKLEGRATWGEASHAERELYAPGTRDLLIVMQSLPRTRFVVVDAETRAPIERFGLEILEENGSKSKSGRSTEKRRPTVRDQPGGSAEATARVGIDLYVIGADDYLMAMGDVKHDVEGTTVQTVRLRRGATVRGRLVRDGAPLASTRVDIVQVYRGGRSSGAGVESQEVHVRKNTRRTTESGADGVFEIRALDPVTQLLTVRPTRGAPYEIPDVVVSSKGVLDLGDVIVRAGGTIVGEIQLPPGIEAAGLGVYLDDANTGPRALVDASGRFRFDDVAAGTRRVAHDARPGELERGERIAVVVVSGETASVTIDARSRAMVTAEITVRIDGRTAQGCRVALVDARDATVRADLGTCDADGRARGAARAFGDAAVVVTLPGGRSIRHPTARVALAQSGVPVRAEVRFEPASLELRFAAPLPRAGHALLRLEPDDAARGTQNVHIGIADGRFVAEGEFVRATADGVVFEALVAGEHALSLEIYDSEAPPIATVGPRGETMMRNEPVLRRSGRVTLVAGRTAEVAL